MALIDQWPLFGLRLTTPRLELRYPDDELALAVAELTTKGIHPADEMPFAVPWTDAPVDELARNSLQHFWKGRAELAPDDWHLPMVAVVDGEPVGVQSMLAKHFAARRGVETGSWIGRAHQGRGIGTEMRRAVLHLAFEGLGAQLAETSAWHDNAASLAVTRKLGYEPNGERLELRRGAPTRQLQFRMSRDAWAARGRGADVRIAGLEPCLALLGAEHVESAR
jgi:RimJ/RimL family protein N-acetyltransferase